MSTGTATAAQDRRASEIVRSVAGLATRLRELGVDPGPTADLAPGRFEAARAVVDRGLEGVLARLETAPAAERAALAQLVVALHEVRRSLRAHRAARRSHPAKAIDESAIRLRNVATTAGLLDRVCAEAVQTCGLSRVALSTVEGDAWSVCRLHDERDPEAAVPSGLLGVAHADGTAERTVLRTGAGLVVDASGTEERPDVRSPMAALFGGAHVVVPIPVSSGTLGLLHADHHPTDLAPDDIDRDLLQAFARSFGQIFERTALQERLERQRRTLEELLEAETRAARELAGGGYALAGEPESSPDPAGAVEERPVSNADLDALLTPREREVLELILTGASNGVIAERLVITTGTVKSHVKRVLRKLGAANRSEAISRYLGLGDDQR